MKKIILLASAFVFSIAVMAQSKPDDVLKVNTETHSFGKIKQGTPVTYFFELTNKSDKPLVVENASASCGCTVPEKPEEPIKPGETGFLKVVFNSKGRVGDVHKEITVTSNAYPQFPVLELTGLVVSTEK